MARKVSLFRTFNNQRFIRESIRSTREEAQELAKQLQESRHKIRIIKVSSSIHRKGYAYAIYARK